MGEIVLNNMLCFVCSAFGSCIASSVTTSYSGKSLLALIESFIEDLLPKNLLLEEVALCQSCVTKFNLYDNYASKALELKNELISNCRSTQDSTEAEILQSDLQLSDVFPEIEFDFGLDEMIDSDEGMRSAKKEAEMRSDLRRVTANIVEVKRQKDEIAEAEKKIGSKSIPRSKKLIGSLVCDVCDMTNFKNRRGLIAHLNSHKKSKFYCQLCKMSFKAANSFKVHISSNHGTIVNNIPCPFSSCNKQFSSKIALRAHFICHNKDEKNPSFVCETCGKGFHYKLSFTQHQKIHSGVRDKQCENCGFKAISSTHLQRHIRARHTKEKNHVCSYCDRAFSERYNMMSHVRKQHINKKAEPKPLEINFFKCIVCSMEYSEEYKLMQHLESSHNIVEVEDASA